MKKKSIEVLRHELLIIYNYDYLTVHINHGSEIIKTIEINSLSELVSETVKTVKCEINDIVNSRTFFSNVTECVSDLEKISEELQDHLDEARKSKKLKASTVQIRNVQAVIENIRHSVELLMETCPDNIGVFSCTHL